MTRPILRRSALVIAVAAMMALLHTFGAARQAALIDLPPMPGRAW